MTPRELLGVFVRLAGLGSLVMAVFDIYNVAVKTLGIATSSTAPIRADARGAIIYLVLGLGILAASNLLVRLAYWQPFVAGNRKLTR